MTVKSLIAHATLIALLLGVQGCSHEVSPRKVSETSLGKIESSTPVAISPDGRQLAYALNKKVVVVNGQETKAYAEVFLPLHFSPDSRRLAFVAQVGSQTVMVADGKEGKPYDPFITNEVFSPDSAHFAYVAPVGNKFLVTVDGEEGRAYDNIEKDTVTFSPNGRRIAYWACSGEKCFVVTDGKEGRPYSKFDNKGGPVFSPDSRRVAYSDHDNLNGASTLVVDGKALSDKNGKHVSPTGMPIFSRDGQRMAVAAAIAGLKSLLVVDGEESQPYEGQVSDLCFSPDSRYVAYSVATLGRLGPEDMNGNFFKRQWFPVIGGKAGKTYDGFSVNSGFVFSPDSQHIAYLALIGEKRVAVVDGKESKPYDEITDSTVFSPDSRHFAYKAQISGKWVVVVDDKAGKLYDGLGPQNLVFGPDSLRIVYWALLGKKWRVVVNDSEGKPYDGFPEGAPIVFDSANRFHYLARSDSPDTYSPSFYLIDDAIE